MTKGKKTVVLNAMLNLGGHDYPIILKRNSYGDIDQIVVDELKPLFGLTKMGTHQISLYGIPRKHNANEPWILDGRFNFYIFPQWSEYFIFQAHTITDSDGRISFVQLPAIQDVECFPTCESQILYGHKLLYYEIQKILVFRDLLKVTGTNLTNILFKYDLVSPEAPHPVPLSINELHMKLNGETYPLKYWYEVLVKIANYILEVTNELPIINNFVHKREEDFTMSSKQLKHVNGYYIEVGDSKDRLIEKCKLLLEASNIGKFGLFKITKEGQKIKIN